MTIEPNATADERGFTLMELLVTLSIIAVLASMVLPLAEAASRRNKEQELRTALRDIREGIDAYKHAVDDGRIAKKATESGYPNSLETLVAGVEDQKDPKRRKLYFLRRIPRDPLNPNLSADAASTWGKRSYASPPDDPCEGDDIYDIYSLAPGTGMNGVPYKDW